MDQYFSETDVGFVACQRCKPMVDELLAMCKALLEDSLKLNEDEFSRDRQYMLANYGIYKRAVTVIAKAGGGKP